MQQFGRMIIISLIAQQTVRNHLLELHVDPLNDLKFIYSVHNVIIVELYNV